jgi:radical SAM-linked protein
MKGVFALIKVRLRYAKGDEIKYISHLDTLKLFERASRRCGLPVAYTEGFNPRPRFVFGNPLPVGVTSECEFVDIYFDKDMDPDKVVSDLNSVMPKGLRVLAGKVLSEDADNIMNVVSRSEYVVKVDMPEEDARKVIDVYEENSPLVIVKKSKNREREMDIRPMVHNLTFKDAAFSIVTDAGNTSNLRPEVAIKALCGQVGVEVKITGIHRTKLF